MRLVCRPIDSWPGQLCSDSDRERTPFSATWTDTVGLLTREVGMLTPRGSEPEVVLQLALREQDIRRDGWIRADARPVHPGVIVSFESQYGPLRYHTDRYRTSNVWRNGRGTITIPGWQSNVRAIALGLEALRRVDRYGISADGQQYRGWQALPAGDSTALGPGMTVEDAARFIARHSDEPEGRLVDVEGDPTFALALYREAALRLHPDQGGDPAQFLRLQQARDLLRRHAGQPELGA